MLSNLQELLERSIFHALRDLTEAEGYIPSLPPGIEDNNAVVAKAAKVIYQTNIDTIIGDKGFIIEILGASNNQSKGLKKVPRIVFDTQSFQPGDLGGDTTPLYELIEGKFIKSSNPSLSSDFYFDVRIIANNIKELRILNAIVSQSLPRRGYIKTYINETIQQYGNIFITFTDAHNVPDLDEGVMERVFSYKSTDVFEALPYIIPPPIVGGNPFDIVPITDTTLEVKALTDINE